MHRIEGRFIYSASDLNNALECEHLSELEALAARGELSRPQPSETTALLARKGDEHEAQQLARMRALYGEGVVAFPLETTRSLEAYHAAAARAIESDTPRIALAPRRALFGVPSNSHSVSSSSDWFSALMPDTAF